MSGKLESGDTLKRVPKPLIDPACKKLAVNKSLPKPKPARLEKR